MKNFKKVDPNGGYQNLLTRDGGNILVVVVDVVDLNMPETRFVNTTPKKTDHRLMLRKSLYINSGRQKKQ